jgi:hypothetical protein
MSIPDQTSFYLWHSLILKGAKGAADDTDCGHTAVCGRNIPHIRRYHLAYLLPGQRGEASRPRLASRAKMSLWKAYLGSGANCPAASVTVANG